GVSKATLYAYFSSKDRLFATIISDACAGGSNAQTLFPAAGSLPRDDPRTALTLLGAHMLRFMLDDEVLSIHRVVIAESPRFPELGRAFYDGGKRVSCEWMADWIAEQRAAGLLFVDDARQAAQHWMALLRGDLFLRGMIGLEPRPTEAEIDAAVEGAVDLFMRAYGRPPTRTAAPDLQFDPAVA
ncbi:MAG: TetR/AcrR family transcriptional regulator C-terminal domain-containing protein, partial [Acetobacteraceae bacterium]